MTKSDRSLRFKIESIEAGYEENPTEHPTSAFGDPVNFMYLITDKLSAERAKVDFQSDVEAETYKSSSSVGVIQGRINRLCRKYGSDPLPVQYEATSDNKKLTRLFAPVLLEKTGDKSHVIIPASRNAVFQHPWYGTVHFDNDLFDSFRDNWESGVVGTDLAINAEHGRNGYFGGMALAWVDALYTQDGVFNIGAEPTPTGQAVIGQEYRYASIEYMDNWVDQETGVSYGPTLVGCAVTNIPFVHRNQPIKNEVPFEIEGETDMPKQTAPQDGQPVEAPPATVESTPTTTTPAKLEAPAIDKSDYEKRLAEAERKNRAILEVLKSTKITAEIDAARNRGVAPVILDVAGQLLNHCDPMAEKTINLSLGDQGYLVNFFEAITKLLSIAPARDLSQIVREPGQETNPRPQDDQPKPKTLEQAEAEAIEYRKNHSNVVVG